MSGFGVSWPILNSLVVTVIVPLIVPLAVGVRVTESTLWPVLAALKATVTAELCGSQPEPDSDTGKPMHAEGGAADSVCVLKARVAVPSTFTVPGMMAGSVPLPGSGVVLGSSTTTAALGPAGTVVGT